MELTLEIVEGPGAGTQMALRDAIEVGRDPEADLVLADEQVSRRHARISQGPEGPAVQDLDSRNGTFVNGNEIHAPTQLRPGDQLLMGVTVVRLRTADEVRAQPSAVRPVPPGLAQAARRPDYVPREVAEGAGRQLESLLDKYTKSKARTAPVAIFVLVVFVVIVFLALR